MELVNSTWRDFIFTLKASVLCSDWLLLSQINLDIYHAKNWVWSHMLVNLSPHIYEEFLHSHECQPIKHRSGVSRKSGKCFNMLKIWLKVFSLNNILVQCWRADLLILLFLWSIDLDWLKSHMRSKHTLMVLHVYFFLLLISNQGVQDSASWMNRTLKSLTASSWWRYKLVILMFDFPTKARLPCLIHLLSDAINGRRAPMPHSTKKVKYCNNGSTCLHFLLSSRLKLKASPLFWKKWKVVKRGWTGKIDPFEINRTINVFWICTFKF